MTYIEWRNHAPKLTSGLLIAAMRKGADFNDPDADGQIPLHSLAELASPQRNLLNVSTFADLACGAGGKRVTPDWRLTDEHGNTALHWLFSRAPMPLANRRARHGISVQEFARALCRNTAAAQAMLAEIDLMAVNNDGESIIILIADHCLHPRSRRIYLNRHSYRHHGMHWPNWDEPIMPPERFSNCLHVHKQLYAAWMQLRAPLVSVFQSRAAKARALST